MLTRLPIVLALACGVLSSVECGYILSIYLLFRGCPASIELIDALCGVQLKVTSYILVVYYSHYISTKFGRIPSRTTLGIK